MEMKKYKLGNLGNVCMCKRILKEQTNSISGIPFFKIGTFGGEADVFIDRETFESYKKLYNYPKKGDVLISAAGTIGRTVIFDGTESYFQDSNIVWIANDESQVLNKYLFYCYKNIKWFTSKGSTILRLYNDNIKNSEIVAPSLSEQGKIISVLSSLDDKIALNNRINAKLEQMAKRLYDYWFVQFDFPVSCHSYLVSESHNEEMLNQVQHDECTKPYKSTGGKMVWNEELKREMPEGWEVKKIKNVIEPIERGLSYSSDDILRAIGKPMINLACFDKTGNYRTGELKYYSGDYSDSDLLSPMDILIACTDLTQKADIIGTPIFVSNEYDNFVYSTDLAKLTPKDLINKFYIYYYLKNDTFHRYIKPFASGTTVKHLNLNGVLEYPYIQPNEEVISSFNKLIEPIRKKIVNLQTENVQLAKLRDKLLPLLMNGQVVVE